MTELWTSRYKPPTGADTTPVTPLTQSQTPPPPEARATSNTRKRQLPKESSIGGTSTSIFEGIFRNKKIRLSEEEDELER